MKPPIKLILITIVLFTFGISALYAQQGNNIKLLVRADDMGSSHAANRASIDSYTHGIVRSVEVMVNGSWFLEAAEMLRQHPGYDVGVHLTLTSEWDNVKWRPLTHVPSLVDSNGYFFPMVWANENYKPERTLIGADWKLCEIEKELRAQIELALRHIPQVSHVTSHMVFCRMDGKVAELVKQLAKEYGIYIDLSKHNFKNMAGWRPNQSLEEKIDTFISNLKALTPGNYLFVEHPAYDDPEMQATSHPGYTDVAIDRYHVTRILTSPKVLQTIKEKGIVLVGYNDFQ